MKDKNDVVMIELDRPRELFLGHKALKRLSALLGKPLAELDTEKFSSEEIEKVMYCLMLKDAKEHGEDLKLEQMEDLLDMVKFGEVISKMSEAFEVGFGVAEEIQEKNAQRIATIGKKA